MFQPNSRSSWRFLDTGFLTGYENMAIDEAVFIGCREKKLPPTIRIYGWTPPAVSLGYFQKAENAVDLEACRRRGVDVVRRLSGGRSVLHHRELTYSIICREGTPPLGSSVLETYKTISKCLITTLKALGLDVKWVASRDKHAASMAKDKTASCFSSPSWYEITVEGKKICGSAQKRGDGVLLQHGSLLIEYDPELLAEVLVSKKEEEEFLTEIRTSTTAINQHLSQKVDFDQLKKLVLQGFKDQLKIFLSPGELSEYESHLKNHLLKEKYSTDSWNLHRQKKNGSL
jgi:lipoate-protein ligase A